MNLHIARGDQKLGPYSLAEAQGLLDAGTLLPSDLAWWKGQPGWIPLPQVPGIVVAVSGQRPVGVWVICGIYLALILMILGSSLWSFFHLLELSSSNSPQVYINYLGFVISTMMQLVKLAGVVLLFKLRRSALYVLGGVFGVSLLFTGNQMLGLPLLHGSYSSFIIARIIFTAALNLIMLAYVWHLFLKGVLR
jgi:uncharacterized protein DUF4339